MNNDMPPLLSSTNEPFLIVGLGNPGNDYLTNRHNVGFMLLTRLAEHLGERFSRLESRALVSKTVYQGHRVILAKPQTFMNASGSSVRSLVHFYKVPLQHLLVTYDDVDLPLETIRLRADGGSGGQKGMQSIIDQLGNNEFPRLRIGIGRPSGRMEAADYVLQNFSKPEQEIMSITLDRAIDAILAFITSGLDQAMNLYNG